MEQLGKLSLPNQLRLIKHKLLQKRQYFVARSGVLLVYSNKTQEELTDRLEMFGGHVDFMVS